MDSPEEMVEAAKRHGYEYVAITDHSRGLGVAHGLTVERIRDQRRTIERLNRRLASFRVLHGVDVDIRADGTLDYPDEVLRGFDIVTAPIHGGFDQPSEKMTARVLKAIRNPVVGVFNHPRGRLIGKRAEYAIDLEAVIRTAAELARRWRSTASPTGSTWTTCGRDGRRSWGRRS